MVSSFIVNIIGMSGALGVISAFIFEDLNRIERGGIIYNLLNLIGSALLLTNAIITRNIAFCVLNLTWVVISLYFLIKRNRMN